MALNCGSLMFIIQNLTINKLKPQLVCVTRGVFSEIGCCFEQSSLWGMCRTVSFEHSNLDCLRIDLDNEQKPNLIEDSFIVLNETFLNEKIKEDGSIIEDEVSFKKNQKFVPNLVSKTIPDQEVDKLRENEQIYLITGGLGGLGLAVAKFLHSKGAKKLILLSRKNRSQEEIKNLALPSEFVIEQGDVCNYEQLKILFEKHNPTGIIHCAGVWSNALIMNQTFEKLLFVFKPKVIGALNLHLLSLKYKIKTFILFSSFASILGSPGQCNYTAANFFLDSLSEYRKSNKLPSLVINWGAWGDIGIASRSSTESFVEQIGLNNFTPKEGINYFSRIYTMNEQIVVVSLNWRKVLSNRVFPLPVLFSKIKNEIGWKKKSLSSNKQINKLRKKLSLYKNDKKRRHNFLVSEIQSKVAVVLQTEPNEIGVHRPLMELGMDSLAAVELRNKINESIGLNIPPTVLFDYPNIDKLAEYLEKEIGDEFKDEVKQEKQFIPRKISSISDNSNDIAVVGYSCRLPTGTLTGFGNNPESFWKMFVSEKGCSEEIPANRFDYEEFYDKDGGEKKMYVKWGTFINDPFKFDAGFFGISSEEAKSMDPQQRLLLECTWEALEIGGILPSKLIGSKTGVYIGNMFLDYKDLINYYQIINYAGTGNHLSVLAGRISYIFGFEGPVITMDTACSSSLVTTHLACQSLRNNECNLAVAGGVNLLISPQNYVSECAMRMLSPEGLCKTFDDTADGYLRGEGCGIILLKRLEDAKRDGNNILAVIRGSATNHDGRSAGLTAPNGKAQQDVIKTALKMGGLSPNDIDYIEAHGTGTSLGDPIEIRALTNVFGKNRDTPLYISSAKTYIGHAEGTAGIAGVLKLILSLHNEKIPKHLNLKKINKLLPNLDDFKMVIPIDKSIEWKRNSRKRIGGVSSFGFSGTNAHVIIEEGIPFKEIIEQKGSKTEKDEQEFLFLSAKSEKSLKNMASNYIEFLNEKKQFSLSDLCYTVNTQKEQFNFRVGVSGKTKQDIIYSLHSFIISNSLENEKEKQYSFGDIGNTTKKLVFFYTGQGSQYFNMGKELFLTNQTFKKWMIKCDEILRPFLDNESILDIIFKKENELKLNSTKYVQPALFVLEYSATKMFESLGVYPDFVIGHSLGEIVAACVSGVLSLKDGLKLISIRAKCMLKAKTGSMAAIFISEEETKKVIKESKLKLSIASLNGQTNTVISGKDENIEKILKIFTEKKIKFKKLKVNNAFHSELMDPILDEFEKSINNIIFNEPNIPLISNLYGEIIEDYQKYKINAKYWSNHIRSTVKFYDGIKNLFLKFKNLVFIEVGPKNHLIGMTKRILYDKSNLYYIPSFVEKKLIYYQTLCDLYCSGGIDLNFSLIYKNKKNLINPFYLPLYPFEPNYYNCIPEEDRIEREFIYTQKWIKKPVTEMNKNQEITGTILCFSDQSGFGESLGHIMKTKTDIVGVVIREKFELIHTEKNIHIFSINPKEENDYTLLFNHEIWKKKKPLQFVINCFSLDLEDPSEPEKEDINESISYLYSIVFIIKNLVKLKLNPKIIYITKEVQTIYSMFKKKDEHEEGEPSILQSYMWGMCKSVRLEHPEFKFTLIDIEEETKPGFIESELVNISNEREISYCQNERYVPRIDLIKKKKRNEFEIGKNDVFLITGGTSGLGFGFTKYLIEKKGLKNVVLVSRSGIKNNKIKNEIEKFKVNYKVNIIVEKVDVSNFNSLKITVEKITKQLGKPVNGILHCAGIFDNCLLVNQNFKRFSKLFLPKVYGTLNLYQLNLKLKHFILFSSDASTFGDTGQTSYSAANSFLDSFSSYSNFNNRNCVSINWGLFGDSGAVTTSTDLYNQEKMTILLKYSGQGLLTIKKGVEMFENIMSENILKKTSRIGAVKLHLRNLIRYKFNGNVPSFIENIKLKSKRKLSGGSENEEEEEEISELATKFIENSEKKFKNDEEYEIYEKKMITKDVQLIIEKMLDKEENTIDITADLTELGVDSLTGLSIRNNLSKYTGISLPVNMAFTNPNIQSIGEYVFTQKEEVLNKANEIKIEKTDTSSFADISFFDGVKRMVKSFIKKTVLKVLKESKIGDNQQLHQLEANVDITNTVRSKIMKEFKVNISVEEFFKTPTINRYSNMVLKVMIPNFPEKSLFKELDTNTKLPKSLGYIYDTNYVQCAKKQENAKLRLFLTPPAGMNPSFFRKIVPFFPDTIELCFLHLPGRTSRLGESLMVNMMDLAKDITTNIKDLLTDKIPYAFFGHCMGTQINYEVVCEIRRRGLPLPQHFYVFSGHAPHITNSLFPSYELTDDGILEFIKKTNDGVLPKPLQNKEMNKLVFSIMRADLQKVASQDIEIKKNEKKQDIIYHEYYKEEIEKLPLNISSWGGGVDQFVPIKFIKQWKDLITGNFKIEVFPESNHYAYVDIMGELKDEDIIKKIVKEVEKLTF